MTKFEKFNAEKHLRGLVHAARAIQQEERGRDEDISFHFGANEPEQKAPAPRPKRRVQ